LLLPLVQREEMGKGVPRSRRKSVQLAECFDAGYRWPAGPFLRKTINFFLLIKKFKYVFLKVRLHCPKIA
jgi:hypothetical protein